MFLYYLLSYLDREQYEPFVAFYFYNQGPDTAKIRDLGIPVFFLNRNTNSETFYRNPLKLFSGKSKWKWLHEVTVFLRFSLRLAFFQMSQLGKLLGILKREDIVLIMLNNDVHYHLVGALAAKIAGIPCICRKAGGIGEGKRIKKLLTPWMDLFIAISDATAADQRENNPSTKRLVTIKTGIDLKGFVLSPDNPDVRRELGIPEEKKVIGYVSRIERGKGQDELIEAVSLIVRKYKNVVFVIVGDGDLMKDLQTKVHNLNLDEFIIFTGWRNDILNILSILDIFVHCPTTFIEGLAIASLEAMAMGKPTVVSNNGGLPDAVIDGITGFVVPPGDIEGLSAAILRFLEDKELAIRLGRNARQRVEKEFDIKKNIKKLEVLLDEYALRQY